jgi:hypothetical protein
MAILAKMLRVSGRGPNEDGWMLLKQASGNFDFCMGGGGGVNGCVAGNSTSVRSTTTAAANTWYHLAVVKSAGAIAIYVNGAHEATTSLGPFADTHTVNLKIGAYAPDFGDHPRHPGRARRQRLVPQ